ncbi:MAG TPA: hypothetical protein VFI95_11810 [Terriglobales bacterium]|nr:hypothetical protein [Terriglobales bacterium]
MTAMVPILGSPQASPSVPQQYQARTGVPEPPAQHQRVAVIVHHGMGQQVPYETIEGVANAIWSRTGQEGTQPVVRRVRLGVAGKDEIEPDLVRAELRVQSQAEGQQRNFDVHIYESYWAPLTEGQVTVRDVISFLKRAGWNGICNTAGRTFHRWMFGHAYEFELPKISLVLVLSGLLALIFSLVFINAVLTAAAAAHAIGSHDPFPSGHMLAALTWDMLLLDIAAIAIFLGIVIGGFPKWRPNEGRAAEAVRHVTVILGWLLIYGGAVVVLFSALAMAVALRSWDKWPFSYQPGGWSHFVDNYPSWVFVIWAIELGAAAAVRWALIEYVGDVTAYIAAYSVSKFWKLRQDIRDVAMKVTRAVYRAKAMQGDAFLYEKIIVVGHSLGSVISYDALNSLLLEAVLSAQPLRVSERTRMFLTFGSPLDKTAFLFRTLKDMHSAVREVGAAAVQPMISDYANRPREWVNLWSRSDIISGALDYYDPPTPQNARDKARFAAAVAHAKAVQNIIDPAARTPLKAHVEYWGGALFAQELVRAITT